MERNGEAESPSPPQAAAVASSPSKSPPSSIGGQKTKKSAMEQPPSPQETSLLKKLDSDSEEDDEEDSDEEHAGIVSTAAQSAPSSGSSGGGQSLFSKNVASVGPRSINIGTIMGDMHIGDIINMTANSAVQEAQTSRVVPQLKDSERDHINSCKKSARRLEEDDIPRVSRQIGLLWKDVGNSLHFTHAQLDQIESDSGGILQDCTEKMLFRWMQWKSERATIKRLSKALYINSEYSAILSMDP